MSTKKTQRHIALEFPVSGLVQEQKDGGVKLVNEISAIPSW